MATEADTQLAGPFWGALEPLVSGLARVPLRTEKSACVLGRGAHADVRFSQAWVSTAHATVEWDEADQQAAVTDSSANGTYLNGERLDAGLRTPLNDGDVLSLVVNPDGPDKAKAFAVYRFCSLQPEDDTQLQPSPAKAAPKSPAKFAPGSIQASYELMDKLGSGTYADVFRCVHRRSGKHYAVKKISTRQFHLLQGFDVAAVRREIDILAELDHPGLVKLEEVFQARDAIYIVMELVMGGELFERLVTQGALREVDAQAVMRRLLDAVKYLHDMGIVHRDLKPENILMGPPEDELAVKISDFGLARFMGDDGLKTYCGSPQYFAPEVLRRSHTVQGKGRYGKGADMWSLGVILFILLSGRPPFDKEELKEEVENVGFEFDDDFDDVSPEAKDLIAQLLTADAAQRATVEAALAHPWFARRFYDELSKAELQHLLVTRGLPKRGTKAQLVARLEEDDTDSAAAAGAGASAAAATQGLDSIAESAESAESAEEEEERPAKRARR